MMTFPLQSREEPARYTRRPCFRFPHPLAREDSPVFSVFGPAGQIMIMAMWPMGDVRPSLKRLPAQRL